MAITFVGGTTGSAQNGGNVALSLTALLDAAGATVSAATDDLVVVAYTIGAQVDSAMSVSEAGWTEQTELYIAGTTYDSNFAVYTKVMGGTPDTTVTVVGDANASNAVTAVAMVFRGVDTTTPLDVAIQTATGSGTGQPNPPSITPTTAGAWIVVCGSTAASIGIVFTVPADLSATTNHFRSVTRADTNDSVTGIGIKTDWASGAFDPGVWTSGTTVSTASWAAATLALRPAAGAAATSFVGLRATDLSHILTR